jgi:hypothetical protein
MSRVTARIRTAEYTMKRIESLTKRLERSWPSEPVGKHGASGGEVGLQAPLQPAEMYVGLGFACSLGGETEPALMAPHVVDAKR